MNFGSGEFIFLFLGIVILIVGAIMLSEEEDEGEREEGCLGCLAYLAEAIIVATGVTLIAISLTMAYNRSATLAAAHNLRQQGFVVYAVNTTTGYVQVRGTPRGCIVTIRITERNGTWFVIKGKTIEAPSQVKCP